MKNNIYEENYNKTLNYKNSDKETSDYINYFLKNYKKFMPPDKGINILDIGCGNGLFLEFLRNQEYKEIFGIDLSPENIEICKKKGLNISKEDAFSFLNKTKKSFDLIVMNDIIEHIPKKEVIQLLKLVRSKLNKDGIVLIKTLNMSNPISLDTLYCDFTHEWGYTEKSIKQVCAFAGFENIEIKNLIIYPNIKFLDWIFPILYKLIKLKYKIVFTFYGKKGNNTFSKNLLCIAK
jgi:2-polyprenyl-3-methyl-5-hydroxy-6-metoxy-1,4-benzoquinol methylase